MAIYGHRFDDLIDNQLSVNEGFFDNLKKKKEAKKAEQEKLRKEAANKTLLEILNKTLKFIKSPYTLGDGYDSDIIVILHKLGMNKESFSKFVYNNKSKFDNILNYMDNGDIDEYEQSTSKSNVEKMKNAVVILNNDDYILFLSLVDRKMYEVDADNFYVFNFKEYNDLSETDWKSFESAYLENKEIKDQIDKLIAKYK